MSARTTATWILVALCGIAIATCAALAPLPSEVATRAVEAMRR